MTHTGLRIHNCLIDCQTCGFIHVDPLPDQKTVDDYYKSKFYEETKPDYLDRHTQDKEWWDLTYSRILTQYESLTSGLPVSVLDYGCGHGLFLDYLRDRGIYSLFGVELSGKARRSAQKQGLEVASELQSDWGEGEFDFINLYQVLEHVPDPNSLIRTLKPFLSDEGYLVITVPNDFNPLQNHSSDPYWISPIDHLNYFTEASLTRLLNRHGFYIGKVLYHFPMELFWLMGDDYRGNDGIGRTCHKKRVRLEQSLSPQLLESIYSSLGELRIGREFTIFASR